MGRFQIMPAGGREIILPNTFCTEGAAALWEQAFGGAVAYQFQLGLTGLNIPCDRSLRPDGYNNNHDLYPVPEWWKLDADTRMIDITGREHNGQSQAPSHEGGVANAHDDGVHRRWMGYARQTVSFTMNNNGGGIEVCTGWAQFANHAPWDGVEDDQGVERWLRDEWLAPDNHGWPWCTPVLPGGYVDARYTGHAVPVRTNPGVNPPEYDLPLSQGFLDANPDFPNGWSLYLQGSAQPIDSVRTDPPRLHIISSLTFEYGKAYWYRLRPITRTAIEMDGSAWRATSLPVKAVFLCAVDAAEHAYLVAASNFNDSVLLFPGQSLFCKYSCRMSEVIEGRDAVY